MLSRWTSTAALLALSLSCSSTPEGTVSIVTGDETDVFSRAPAPVTLVTETIALDGKRAEISRTSLPADTVQLGNRARDEVGGIAVTGLDGSGAPVVRGETLLVQWGAIEQDGLEVFAQRTGELARMPLGPGAFDATGATMLDGRYVLGVNGTTTILYDLLLLKTLTSIALPRPAKSIVPVGTATLVVDEAGATTIDFADGSVSVVDPPTGGTYADVAGGARVSASDGTQFIVGATRATGAPTVRVLVVDSTGKATFAALATPRLGACATFVEGRGLVVYGGDATAAGAELLATGAAIATPLPFPPDAIKGCGATALDTGHVAIAGGAAGPVRVLDLACTTGCTLPAWPDSIPLVRAEAATLAPDTALFLGDDATGATHLFRASATGTREIPLRVPRRGAHLVITPTNAYAVVGGGAGIEQYRD
jgi:hypothetical protein